MRVRPFLEVAFTMIELVPTALKHRVYNRMMPLFFKQDIIVEVPDDDHKCLVIMCYIYTIDRSRLQVISSDEGNSLAHK
jgi:hypothetical protein